MLHKNLEVKSNSLNLEVKTGSDKLLGSGNWDKISSINYLETEIMRLEYLFNSSIFNIADHVYCIYSCINHVGLER